MSALVVPHKQTVSFSSAGHRGRFDSRLKRLVDRLKVQSRADMGTTYPPQHAGAYSDAYYVSLSRYPAAMTEAERQRTVLSEAQAALTGTGARLPSTQNHAQQQPHDRTSVESSLPTQNPPSISERSAHPATPIPQISTTQVDEEMARRDSTMVNHSLEIPACISAKGGDLAELAAQVWNLFIP
jgi:hypothetical protein